MPSKSVSSKKDGRKDRENRDCRYSTLHLRLQAQAERVAPSSPRRYTRTRSMPESSTSARCNHGYLQLLQTLYSPPPHYCQLNPRRRRGCCLLRGALLPQHLCSQLQPRPDQHPGNRVRGQCPRHSLHRKMLPSSSNRAVSEILDPWGESPF